MDSSLTPETAGRSRAGVPFETEEELRARGTAKTPDVLLSCPVGVRVRRRTPRDPLGICGEGDGSRTNEGAKEEIVDLEDDDEYEWKVICWIDSKVWPLCYCFFVLFDDDANPTRLRASEPPLLPIARV